MTHRRQGATEFAAAAEEAARSGALAVAVSGCTRRYGTGAVAADALRGVALEVAPGEFVVILGPSGSGKTTLLNVIGGSEEATGGSVVVAGADIAALNARELTAYRRDRVGFVFQFVNLVPTLTALENVQLLAEVTGGDAAAPSRAALERVGLAEVVDRFPAQLSGGQTFGQFANMLPLLFLVAAVLGAFILLSRLVAAQRAVIGTLAANGIGPRTVRRHYLGYVLGAGIGLARWFMSNDENLGYRWELRIQTSTDALVGLSVFAAEVVAQWRTWQGLRHINVATIVRERSL